ncbi:MAG: hypothetical protein ACRDPG_05975 [Nocardioidaceae bacterium]
MSEDSTSAYPARGEVFLDARGNGRAMRLTWHHESDVVVLSLWRDGTCAGTFRLAREDVNEFVDALVDGLRGLPGVLLPSRDPSLPLQQPASSQTPPPVAPSEQEGRRPAAPAGTSFTDWAFGDATAS